MKNKCPKCGLVSFQTVRSCPRCSAVIGETENISSNGRSFKSAVIRRTAVCVAVCVLALGAFYASLVFSADPLSAAERRRVDDAIALLERSGFSDEVFYLRYLAVYRASDNWLNASVAKESAFAATNFPFEIVTLYPDFFTYPADNTEQAAILLHEAKHLQGLDEKDAYEFVWKNRGRIGWTGENYGSSRVWYEIRKQTMEYAPDLFICDFNPGGDCTETSKPPGIMP